MQHDAESQIFLASIEREYLELPEIRYLDDYLHFRSQLEKMRSRAGPYNAQKFGMEFALLMRVNDYDRRIGVPEFPMPGPDGQGGLLDLSVVPEAWL